MPESLCQAWRRHSHKLAFGNPGRFRLEHVREEVQGLALSEARAGGPLTALPAAHGLALLFVDPPQFHIVHGGPLALQQHTEPPVAESAALTTDHTQPSADLGIVRFQHSPDNLWIDIDQLAGVTTRDSMSCHRPQCWRPALPGCHHGFPHEVFKHRVVEYLGRQRLLPLRVLRLQRLRPASLGCIPPSKLSFPLEVRHLANAMPSANVRRSGGVFLFCRDRDDLCFVKSALLYHLSPLSTAPPVSNAGPIGAPVNPNRF